MLSIFGVSIVIAYMSLRENCEASFTNKIPVLAQQISLLRNLAMVNNSCQFPNG